jgi:hypothetical protein
MSSGAKPRTAFCTEGSAVRKCGIDAIIGNGIDTELPLTKSIIIKNLDV